MDCLPLFVRMTKLISGDYLTVAPQENCIYKKVEIQKTLIVEEESHTPDVYSASDRFLPLAQTRTHNHMLTTPTGARAVSQSYHQLRPFVEFCLIGSPAA